MTANATPQATLYTAGQADFNQGRTEIAFVLDNVADWQTLAKGVRAGVEVVVLDSRGDGLAQMADYLAHKTPGSVDAIHLLGHGSQGAVDMGTLVLDSTTAAARSADMTALGAALTPEGDLLLYGCSIANGDGATFLERVAELTGADIAASDDLTGSGPGQSDWSLEVNYGEVNLTPLSNNAFAPFQGTLAPETITFVQGSAEDTAARSNGDNGSGTFTRTIGGATFTFKAGSTTTGTTPFFFDIQDDPNQTPSPWPTGVYAQTDRGNSSGTDFSVSIESGYTFDLTGFKAQSSTDNIKVFYVVNGSALSADRSVTKNSLTTFSSETVFNDVTEIILTAENFTLFQDLVVDDIKSTNTAPTITSGSTASLNENASTSTVVYTATASDAESNAISYSLSGTDASSFSINSSTGVVRKLTSANYEVKNSYSIDVVASDGTASSTKTVTVSINDVNETPVFSSGTTGSVAENASTSTVVYTASATDPESGAITYAISGTDAASFVINSSTGALQLKSSANYEAKTSYSLNVLAQDGVNTGLKSVTISVTNVNEPPVITAPASQNIDQATATALTGISVADPDSGANPITVSLSVPAGTFSATSGSGVTVAGDGTSSLTLTGTQTNINNFIAASKLSYTSAVGATGTVTLSIGSNDGGNSGSGGTQTDSKTETLNIQVTNATPTLTTPTPIALTDTAAADTFTHQSGTLSGSDTDGTIASYGISSPTSTSANFTDSGVTYDISKTGTYGTLYVVSTGADKGKYLYVPNATAINAVKTNVSDSFTVTTTDNGGASGTATLSVNVSGANDTPTDVALSGTSASIYDGMDATLGSLSSTDADTGDTYTYTLVSGTGDTDNASFNISGSSLRVNDPATLGAGTYSVRVRTTDAGGLTFEKAFTVTVNADLTVGTTTIDSSAPSSFASDMADGGGLDLREALYYANLSTGNVTVKFAQTLQGTITLGGAYTVRDGVSFAMDSDTDSRTITINSKSLALGGAFGVSVATGDTLLINSSLTDDGSVTSALTKTGAGKLVLGGTNNTASTGLNTIAASAGTLEVSAASNLGTGGITLSNGVVFATAGNTLTVANDFAIEGSGASFNQTGSGHLTLSGQVAGSSPLSKTGDGSLTLSYDNGQFDGGVQVNGGTVYATSTGESLGYGSVTLKGGTLVISGASTVANPIAVNGDATITNDTDITVSGAISGSSALTKTGSGKLTLSGNNNHSGALIISTGTVAASGGKAIGDSSAVTVSGTLQVLASETIGALSGSGTVTLGTSILTLSQSTSTTFSGTIGGAGGLTHSGSGTLTLSGTNTYTGTTTVSAGGLTLAGGAAIADKAVVSVSNGATLTLAASETIGSLAGAGNVVLSSHTLTAGGNNTSTTASGVISGTGSLVKAGTGTLTLSGSNTYSGTTTVSGGTLKVAGDSNLGGGAVILAAGSTLQVTGATTLDNALTLTGSATLSNSQAVTFSGALSASGTPTLAKTGAGALTYTGTSASLGASVNAMEGSLWINGSLGLTGTQTVYGQSGSTVGGSGTVAAQTLDVRGDFKPGANDASVGKITVQSALVLNGALAWFDLNGTTAGTGYDQVDVTGTVTLGGGTAPTLNASIGYTAAAGDTFVIINNDGSDAVTGTFDGLAEGASFQTLDGKHVVQISYVGGTGNDVTLKVMDTTGPVVNSITLSDTALKIGDTAKVTFTFSEAVTDFTNADLTIANGTLSAVSSADGGTTWSATLTPSANLEDATNVITVDNSGVKDLAGNAGSGTTDSGNYKVDTQRPSATLTVDDTALKIGDTAKVTFSFSEAVTGFTNADLTIANGTLSSVSSADGGLTWSATLTPSANIEDSSNVITLDNSGVADLAGNAGSGSTDSGNYAIDTQRPTATLALADSKLTVGETSKVTITFSEAVSGFTNADLTIANGSLSSVSSSDGGITWTATFTPSANIEDTSNVITLDNTGVTDAAGNAGSGTTDSGNYQIDTQRPSLASSISISDTALKIGDTATVTFTFSEAVSGFTTTDVKVASGALSSLSSSDGGTTWTATLTPTANTTAASNLLTLDNTGVADAAGNAGTGSSDSGNYAVDTQRPTVTLVLADTKLTVGETSKVTITFSEAVTGFTNADLKVANGTLSSVSSSDGGITWSATFTPTDQLLAAGNVITLDNTGVADLAGNAGSGSTDSGSYDIDTTMALTSATYNASTGVLTVTAINLGVGDTIDVSKLSLSGEGGQSYTLTSSNVTASSATSFSITLNPADQAQVGTFLNKAGTSATGGASFNLAGAAGWNKTTGSGADLTGNAVTVSNVPTPSLSSASYDAGTGSLVLTGSGLLALDGKANEIIAGKLTFSGEAGATYTLTDTANVDISSATSATLSLSATDRAALGQILNKNGLNATGGATYNIAAAEDWAAGADAAVNVADLVSNGVTVSNVPAPTLASVVYNATTGTLELTGAGFVKLAGTGNDIVANKFTFTGEGGETYTLTTSANVDITSATSATLVLSEIDRQAVNLILNKAGASATGGATYNIAAADDWAAGADAALNVADLTGNSITVSSVPLPTLSSATYDGVTGVLTVTGTNLVKLAGAANDIDVSKLKITGEAGATYTLTSAVDVEISSGTGFALTLDATDRNQVEQLLSASGIKSKDGTVYLLSGLEDWAAGAATAVDVADLIGNGITVTLPTATEQLIDGTKVSTKQELNGDGSSTTTLTVTPVSGSRQDTDPTSSLADIPLANDSTGTRLLGVSLPVGIGVSAQGVSGGNLTLRQKLINASQPRVDLPADFSQILNTGIDAYVPTVGDQNQVTVRTLTLSTGGSGGTGSTAPAQPIVISGATGTGEADAAHPQRQEALVIDARTLPAGTVLDLRNVEFAIVIGPSRLVGGSGANVVVGDGSQQFIVLGPEDDVLRGGAGDDTVGSKSGNDKLFGDEGNDWVVGGAGNDQLEGGSGNDILQGGQSDAGTWTFVLNRQGQLVSSYVAKEAELADAGTYSRVGSWAGADGSRTSDDRLAFSYESEGTVKAVATLFNAVLGRLPTVGELNQFATAGHSSSQLAELAYNHYLASHSTLAGQPLSAQVQALVTQVWGAANVTPDIINTGVTYITQGGSWAQGLLWLSQQSQATGRISDASGNLALAQSLVVNETGWSSDTGADTLSGGEGNDLLVGGRGNDWLDGGSGLDMAVYSGRITDYTFHQQMVSGVLQTIVSNRYTGEVDTLIGVEYGQVGSKYYGLGMNANGLPPLGQEVAMADYVMEFSQAQITLLGIAGV